MANTQRYKPAPPWSVDSQYEVEGILITTESADLKERHTGRLVMVEGARRVTFQAVSGDAVWPEPKPRAKSFYGESAWSDAQRFVRDEALRVERARR